MVDIPREALQSIHGGGDGDEPKADFEQLCRDLEQVNDTLPDGYRVEIIGGKIIMSPWSQGRYLRAMRSLERQLRPHAPEGHEVGTEPCLFRFPAQERGYGPDLHVADEALVDVESIFLPGEALSLVGEVTSSSTRAFDLTDKVDVYGRGGVPVYVLIDMAVKAVTVYHDPTPDRGYRAHTQVKFGDKVRIPAPFDCEVDTAAW
ncbi:Uma2 family endonuclease [Streptomyces mobaraensis NBRC 13819 = DSM 40847]|uniref:Putative restriction endonuclease domain-containing protein n=1 Tax=Streptomyces mobaraensis (strain ATCC 29032 / DSM 40847 / JCM 4168 / NBRC 13819 / NCIMB 11159 / IPCR 16-22) TaxID=1223523 RepID=M3A3W3_STRM1|nr:Uma2 family endonuclease [Streptomyces mobaraensis]EME99773.1 hypothetical protein H340_14561 [Streptomyces mobaraensis NBRC 13819 = DSM 40847]QTT73738.1 Uma2 family endonuclease [Streptomyces mobaraensis NBRC 13819 = DSM 40847]